MSTHRVCCCDAEQPGDCGDVSAAASLCFYGVQLCPGADNCVDTGTGDCGCRITPTFFPNVNPPQLNVAFVIAPAAGTCYMEQNSWGRPYAQCDDLGGAPTLRSRVRVNLLPTGGPGQYRAQVLAYGIVYYPCPGRSNCPAETWCVNSQGGGLRYHIVSPTPMYANAATVQSAPIITLPIARGAFYGPWPNIITGPCSAADDCDVDPFGYDGRCYMMSHTRGPLDPLPE